MPIPPSLQGDSDSSQPTILVNIIEDAVLVDFDRGSNDAIAQFEETHRVQLARSKRGDDVLNYMLTRVKNGSLEFQNVRGFTGWVCRERPNLLSCFDHAKYTPIHFALSNKLHVFVETVLDNLDTKNDKILLESKDVRGLTSLHMAIQHASPYTKRIIDRAEAYKKRADVFIMQNSKRETPLHFAMILLEPEKPHVFQQTANADVFKSKKHLNGTPSEHVVEQKGSSLTKIGANISRQLSHSARLDGTDDYLSPTKRTVPNPTTASPEESHPTGASDSGSLEFNLMDIVRSLVKANESVLYDSKLRNKEGDTPYLARGRVLARGLGGAMREESTNGNQGKESKDSKLRKLLNGDERATYIRHYAIRNFTRRDALTALYRAGEDRVIEFDLSALGKPSVSSDFLRGLGSPLHFEDLLSYVALPRLFVKDENGRPVEHIHDAPPDEEDSCLSEDEVNPKGTVVKQKTDNAKGTGVSFLCEFFGWLEQKEVKYIHRVAVVDDVEPSHSDSSIECCLKPFEVKVWDWKRFDISADVIVNSAPGVAEVTLYCSGSNAVLRSWGSDVGLRRLAKLESLRLYIREGLETRTVLKNNVKALKTSLTLPGRLPNLRFRWRIDNPDESFASGFAKTLTKLSSHQANHWLTSMKEFARFIENTKEHTKAEPVKIAVIDTGINASLDIFDGKIQSGDSFYQSAWNSGRQGAFYVPSSPHGTLMAQLICEVCPAVKLYVAQLEELPGKEGQKSFSHESATDAINWAVDRGVDIISMSWYMEAGRKLPRLEKALKKAVDKNTLLFCAAIDHGPSFHKNTYPGGEFMSGSRNRLRIGASTGIGEKFTWVSEKDTDFLLPGENVQPAEPEHWTHGLPHGSSISTALGAGLAGVLMYCHRLHASWDRDMSDQFDDADGDSSSEMDREPTDGSDEDLASGDESDQGTTSVQPEYFRRSGTMMRAFEKLSVESESGKFPQVWDHFPANPLKLTWNSDFKDNRAAETRAELKKLLDHVKRK